MHAASTSLSCTYVYRLTSKPGGLFVFSSLFRYGMIDTTRVTCLNESEPGGILDCIKPWDRRMELDPYLESQECEPELLIHVPFSQVVLWLRNANPQFVLSSDSALIYVRFVLGFLYEI